MSHAGLYCAETSTSAGRHVGAALARAGAASFFAHPCRPGTAARGASVSTFTTFFRAAAHAQR